MSKLAAQGNKWDALRERYLKGDLTVDEYVRRILDSKDGDRNRLKIEKKFASFLHSTHGNIKKK